MSDNEKKQESFVENNDIPSPATDDDEAPSKDEAKETEASSSAEGQDVSADEDTDKSAQDNSSTDGVTTYDGISSDDITATAESPKPESATDTAASENTDEAETVFVADDVPAIDEEAPAAISDGNAPEADEQDGDEAETVFVADDVPAIDEEAPAAISDGNAPEADEQDGDEEAAADRQNEDEQDGDAHDADKSKPDTVKNALNFLFDFVELVVISLAAVLLFTTFIMRHSVVEGSSMEGTLYENEHLMISDLFYTPERGDVVVCEDYSTTLRKPLIKRVIGLAGDRIQIEGETVKVNGVTLSEDYVLIDGPMEEYTLDIIIPEGQLFLMGDHRNYSTDSRDFGPVDEDSVIGKVLFRFYPFDKFGTLEKPEYPEGIDQ